jgi:NAD(P)-dependent dehydrogenase (short-subunit alcohol dehydrogenase family)
VVTGAAQGIGRAHAIELGRQGAKVVVNDLLDRANPPHSGAAAVAEEIRAAGGDAIDYAGNVADWDDAHGLVDAAISEYGRLDAVVANAGIIRFGPMRDIDQDRWTSVVGCHVFGTAFVAHAAIQHWTARAESEGNVDARLICTTSQSGLFAAPNTVDYDTAKMAVAGFVLAAAKELRDIGVTVNGIAPRAHTAMADSGGFARPTSEQDIYERAPENVSPVIAWLASSESSAITGRIISVQFGRLAIIEPWRFGPAVYSTERWKADEVGPLLHDIVDQAGPNPPFVMFPPE